jgi:hypothetical protein
VSDDSSSVKVAKDLADSLTAVANAQKAQSEAELAALKSKIGDFAGSGGSGAVEMSSGAGSAEAMLLGASALQRVAAQFAASIAKADPADIVLCASGNVPDFGALLAYQAQFLGLGELFRSATETAPPSAFQQAGVQAESLAAVGLGLDAVSKLLSFAKTDYKFAGIDLTSSDSMLVQALAGLLKLKGRRVFVPALYQPGALAGENPMLANATLATTWSQQARAYRQRYLAAQQSLETQVAAAPGDVALKARLDQAKSGVATWQLACDAIDPWLKQVSSADDKGNPPLATVLRQSEIRDRLNAGAMLLIVQLHKIAGSAYTKKNLWSSLGGTPFYVMGGVVAGYLALDGKTGATIDSRMLPLHGGYCSVNDVADLLENACSTETLDPGRRAARSSAEPRMVQRSKKGPSD